MAQSRFEQQEPAAMQVPMQHANPAPHCWSSVHVAHTWLVASQNSAGAPPSLPPRSAVPASCTHSWSDLQPGSQWPLGPQYSSNGQVSSWQVGGTELSTITTVRSMQTCW